MGEVGGAADQRQVHGVGAVVLAHLLADVVDALGAVGVGEQLLEAGPAAIFTTDATVPWSLTHPNLRVTVIERVGPWEALSRDDSLALTLAAQVASDDAELSTCWATSPSIDGVSRRLSPRRTCSTRCNRIAGLYGLTRYGELFDETEIMFSSSWPTRWRRTAYSPSRGWVCSSPTPATPSAWRTAATARCWLR
ncbi:hypothetical protein [Mycolicibacterium poriferae]|uniref:hypothetical protein n=1 Tax=Mycolicibacterium poriferae TaxID=39694 RepID=UPI001F211993|nr:hypothetical protein [Mycolicibacterium poriferae]